ncbi:MarR family winged helix-turn-helix transcriptional regulator [Salinicola aestuarinus]|uniref:MarR family winged helix-turn-helix transcriptional regulator n=1 Tax=Salinicola aestuarinus TaxID=1949082 RepID=UPI000DA2560E|nr:MarR family winged helix-turn-helix transcriptional regulator [Salinicola aestuarinus]
MPYRYSVGDSAVPPTSFYGSSEDAPRSECHTFTDQVGHLLRRAYQRHTALFQQQSLDSQLTPIQFVTLSALHDRGASSLTQLVKATSIDLATIRGVIKRMQSRGWIETTSDPSDQRKVIVGVTAAGNALLVEMWPRARQVSSMTMKGLNVAERVALIHLLEKMTDSEVSATDDKLTPPFDDVGDY